MKILMFIMLLTISFSGIAHPGHEDTHIMLHDFEHGLWVTSGLIALGLGLLLIFWVRNNR